MIKKLSYSKYGRLEVLKYVGHKKTNGDTSRRPYFLCRCECGTIKEYNGHNLALGRIKSCGCIGKDKLVLRNSTHNGSATPEYRAYYHAKQRCGNPSNSNYINYGGRGIEFRFNSFEEFLEHVGIRPSMEHSLDRIDTNGHYESGNLRWATDKQQANNRRKRSVQRLHEDLLVAYAKQVTGEYNNGITRL